MSPSEATSMSLHVKEMSISLEIYSQKACMQTKITQDDQMKQYWTNLMA